ncbi:hypothetical protein H5410_017830, partial [Solanum commersonii]
MIGTILAFSYSSQHGGFWFYTFSYKKAITWRSNHVIGVFCVQDDQAKCSAFLINGLKIVKPESFLIPLIKNISTLKRTEKTNADKPPAKTPAKNPRIQAPTFLIFLCLSFFTGTTTVLGPGAWAYPDLDSGAIAGLCLGLLSFSARIWYSVKEFVVLEGQFFELRKPPNGRRQSTLQPSCMGSQEHCGEQGCLSLFGQAKERCDQ